jgi:hypothetical protein
MHSDHSNLIIGCKDMYDPRMIYNEYDSLIGKEIDENKENNRQLIEYLVINIPETICNKD